MQQIEIKMQEISGFLKELYWRFYFINFCLQLKTFADLFPNFMYLNILFLIFPQFFRMSCRTKNKCKLM